MVLIESTKYTLGVEIELHTLDKTSWELAPLASQLLESVPDILSRHRNRILTTSERYERIVNELQLVGRIVWRE